MSTGNPADLWRSAGGVEGGSMYVLVIEFDRMRDGETRREKRFWTFADRHHAETECHHFARLAHAGSINFLRNGDKLTFQESRLYHADTEDRQIAKRHATTGEAKLLHHAFNPAITKPTYWDEVLAKLDEGDAID
jgi:hypothetical protein